MICKNCGSVIEFSIKKQQLLCCSCETLIECDLVKEDKKFDFSDIKPLAKNETKELECSGCGAVIGVSNLVKSKNCSYCTKPMVEKTSHDMYLPNYIMPFEIEKKEGQVEIKKWLSSRWFAPNSLKNFAKQNNVENLNACYVPFWNFDTKSNNNYVGQRGEIKTREIEVVEDGKSVTKTETYTKYYPVSGEFGLNFKNHIELAQNITKTHLVDDLGPWEFNKSYVFNDNFLQGFESLMANIGMRNAWESAKNCFESNIKDETKRLIGGDVQIIDSLRINYFDEKVSQIALPIWMATYKFNDKVYNIHVNGQTGKVDGEQPYSWVKIAFTIIALVSAAIIGYFCVNGIKIPWLSQFI